MKITVNRPVFKGFADQQNVRRIVFSQQNVPRRDFHTLFDKIYHNRVEDNLTQSVTNVGAGFFADQVACQLHSIHWGVPFDRDAEDEPEKTGDAQECFGLCRIRGM